jgi:hypothetical protein
MKKLSLEHEVNAFLQNFTEQSPRDVASRPIRLEFGTTHCEYLNTCKHANVAWKGTVRIVEIKNI